MRPLGIKYLRCPCCFFHSDYLTLNWCFYCNGLLFTSSMKQSTRMHIVHNIHCTSECMLKSAHMTQQLQTIIFPSHCEAVKCTAAPAQRKAIQCAASRPLCSPSPSFIPTTRKLQSLHSTVRFTLQVSVAVISQMVSFLTMSLQKIYYTYIQYMPQHFLLYCLETRETPNVTG